MKQYSKIALFLSIQLVVMKFQFLPYNGGFQDQGQQQQNPYGDANFNNQNTDAGAGAGTGTGAAAGANPQGGSGGCQVGKKQSITATCYKDTGVLTASGETLDDNIDTFSELSSGFKENGDPDYAGLGGLPFGTVVKVTTKEGKSLSIKKNDKGGATAQQMDIQQGAMGRLGLPCDGNHQVETEIESCPS